MTQPFDGTLFRFPLRTPEAAATSKLRPEAYTPDAVRDLLASIHARAAELLLFVKNVRSIEVLVKKADAPTATTFFRTEREPPQGADSAPGGSAEAEGAILDFVRGAGGASKGSFYQRLQSTLASKLPHESARMHIRVVTGAEAAAMARTVPEGERQEVQTWIQLSTLPGSAHSIRMWGTRCSRSLRLWPCIVCLFRSGSCAAPLAVMVSTRATNPCYCAGRESRCILLMSPHPQIHRTYASRAVSSVTCSHAFVPQRVGSMLECGSS